MPSELENALARHRRALLTQERQAASAMVRAYGESWARIRVDLMRLHAQMAMADPAPSMVQVLRDERLRALQTQIEAELRRFAPYATESVTMTQAQAIASAQRDAGAAIETAQRSAGVTAGFNRMNPGAVEALVGYASDGSPLRTLFEALGADVAPRVTDTLAQGVALGWGPRVTARAMRRDYGIGLNRSLLIARTETMRAYREAAHATYEVNEDILDGWIWMAAISARSCASCIAMHGTLHPMSEKLNSHPNCRCVAAPHIRDAPNPITPGADRFAALSEEEQRKVLGPGMYEAWRDGQVSLSPYEANSIVGRRDDAQWGSMRYARSLRSIVGPDAAKAYSGVATST